MLVLPLVYHALGSFRQEFSRHRTWAVFCAAVLGFIGTREMLGVSSLCRFWGLEEAGYYQMLHLFRSTAWSAGALMAQWGHFLVKQQVGLLVDGRLVLPGDHTYGVKDATRMPGVVTLHQERNVSRVLRHFGGKI